MLSEMSEQKEVNLFIIAGCNGAGKTTASFTILPEILGCKEFVNADEIAKGLSPFQPETVAFEAGRIMLNRLDELIEDGNDFAFETTLATKSYTGRIKKAKEKGYKIILLFFWLKNDKLAQKRVAKRVSMGGHNIPKDVIERRYTRGIDNLFNIYFDICDELMIVDNSYSLSEVIAEKRNSQTFRILNDKKWRKIQNQRTKKK